MKFLVGEKISNVCSRIGLPLRFRPTAETCRWPPVRIVMQSCQIDLKRGGAGPLITQASLMLLPWVLIAACTVPSISQAWSSNGLQARRTGGHPEREHDPTSL